MDVIKPFQLFAKLENLGIEIQPTRIDRSLLRTPKTIEKLIEEHSNK